MAFIRIKRINGKEYAYHVQNSWTSDGPRQRVAGYLGPVARLERSADIRPPTDQGEFSRILQSIVSQELLNHGFMIDGDTFRQRDVLVDIAGPSVRRGKKEIVLAINEGHLCAATLSSLFQFEPKGHREQIATDLAEELVRAGLKVPHDAFVDLFESLSSRMKVHQQADLPAAPKDFYY